MAKATLPTNFKDDILASSMGSKRRYNVINNSDGTISLEDVTTYTQVGSTFGAAQINATNKAANAAADASKIIDDYDTLMANTQAGYMAGALAVKQLNSNLGYKLTTDGLTVYENRATIIKGGYAVVGDGVLVDITLKFNVNPNASWAIIGGFPLGRYSSNYPLTNQSEDYEGVAYTMSVNSSGLLITAADMANASGHTFRIVGAYN